MKAWRWSRHFCDAFSEAVT